MHVAQQQTSGTKSKIYVTAIKIQVYEVSGTASLAVKQQKIDSIHNLDQHRIDILTGDAQTIAAFHAHVAL
jgi:hypothetical protein